MADFQVGDVVKISMPRGINKRGVNGVHVMYTTSQEAKCNGGVGTVTEVNPVGPHNIPLYLVDFTTHDNSRAGLPYTAYWFREEWMQPVEEKAPVAAG